MNWLFCPINDDAIHYYNLPHAYTSTYTCITTIINSATTIGAVSPVTFFSHLSTNAKVAAGVYGGTNGWHGSIFTIGT